MPSPASAKVPQDACPLDTRFPSVESTQPHTLNPPAELRQGRRLATAVGDPSALQAARPPHETHLSPLSLQCMGPHGAAAVAVVKQCCYAMARYACAQVLLGTPQDGAANDMRYPAMLLWQGAVNSLPPARGQRLRPCAFCPPPSTCMPQQHRELSLLFSFSLGAGAEAVPC